MWPAQVTARRRSRPRYAGRMSVTTRRSALAALVGSVCTRAQAPTHPDVAIIGAGSAGLNAARRLHELGRTTVVLEARGRIGGRAFTETSTFGIPFDRGCAWLHKADDNPYTPLARQWGFTLFEHNNHLDGLWLGSRRATDAERARQTELEAKLDAVMTKRGKQGKDRPGGAWLKRRGLVEDAVATFHGPMSSAVDLDELSTTGYLDIGTDVEPNLLIKEGYGALVARYGREVPVHLNTPVRAVRYSGPGVVLDTPQGAVNARACLVTSSTGVLAAEKIRFDPVLPEWKRDAIAGFPMGLLAKIPLQFQASGLFGLNDFDDLLREQPGKRDIYFLSFPFHLPLLVGFAGGDFAWELSAAGEAEAIDYALNHLRHMFGSGAAKQFIKGSFTQWAGDPWSLGAYAAPTPGNGHQREALRRTVAARVYFAGEACAPRWTQTCGGAALSGRESAEAIHKALGA